MAYSMYFRFWCNHYYFWTLAIHIEIWYINKCMLGVKYMHNYTKMKQYISLDIYKAHQMHRVSKELTKRFSNLV